VWSVAAMFGSDGKIMFTGRTARADSNMRVVSRGGAAGALPIASVPGFWRGSFVVIVASVSQRDGGGFDGARPSYGHKKRPRQEPACAHGCFRRVVTPPCPCALSPLSEPLRSS
jgi:hypothetical protein